MKISVNHLHLLSGRTSPVAAPFCLGCTQSQVEVHANLSDSSLYITSLPLKFVPAVKGEKYFFAQESFLLAASGH